VDVGLSQIFVKMATGSKGPGQILKKTRLSSHSLCSKTVSLSSMWGVEEKYAVNTIMHQWLGLNVGNRSSRIVFESLLTTFEESRDGHEKKNFVFKI